MSTVTKALMALGAYEARFRALPDLLDKFIVGRHLIFCRGQERWFAGVITEPATIENDEVVVAGPGPEWWLGEDDKKGPIREPDTFSNMPTHTIIDDLLYRQDSTRALNPGTLNTGNLITSFRIFYETCRRAIRRLAAATRTEYRVNPDFTFDWAGNSNLFQTRVLVLATDAGTARDVTHETSAYNAASKVIVLANGEGDAMLVRSATAVLPAAWKDWNNAAFQRDFLVDAPNADGTEEADFVASAQAGLRGKVAKKATVELAQAHLLGELAEGDTVYVYKPLVLEDSANQISYRGTTYPAVAMRVQSIEVEPGPDWGVKLRSPDGTEEDLSNLWHRASETKVIVNLSADPEAFFSEINSEDEIVTDIRRDPQTPDPNADGTIPAAPAGLTVTNTKYKDHAGNQRARLKFEWTAVTLNTDGSAIADLARYLVRYRRVTGSPDGAWDTLEVAVPDVLGSVEDLPVGATWEAQVRAEDSFGNASSWAPVSPVNTSASADTTPPPQPKAPVLNGGIQHLYITWEGKDASDQPMPPGIRWYEVYASQASGFTPGPTTLKGEVNGTFMSFDAAEGTWYAKLIAVDFAGNKSAASPQSAVGAVVRKVETGDIGPQAVSGSQIANQAVATAQLADGGVTVGKLAVGAFTADKLVVGNFDNLAEDPGFERQAAGALPTSRGTSSWYTSGAAVGTVEILSSVGDARTGIKSLHRAYSGGASTQNVYNTLELDVRAGDKLYVEGFVRTENSASGSGGYRVEWLDSARAVVGTSDFLGAAPGDVQTQRSGVATAPAGSVFARIVARIESQTAGDWFWDDVYLKRVIVSAFIADLAVITQLVADQAVTTQKVANSAITNAQIANATIESAKIVSLVADKIAAGSLTVTVDITTGLLRTASSGQRAEIDTDGIRLYNSSGVVVVDLDADTGDALFQGIVRTAASGQRIEVDATGAVADRISFFSGDADETDEGRIAVGAGFLEIQGVNRANGASDITLQSASASGAVDGYIRFTVDSIGQARVLARDLMADGETCWELVFKSGGSFFTRTVIVGAANSGGAGVRLMAVAN